MQAESGLVAFPFVVHAAVLELCSEDHNLIVGLLSL